MGLPWWWVMYHCPAIRSKALVAIDCASRRRPLLILQNMLYQHHIGQITTDFEGENVSIYFEITGVLEDQRPGIADSGPTLQGIPSLGARISTPSPLTRRPPSIPGLFFFESSIKRLVCGKMSSRSPAMEVLTDKIQRALPCLQS